MSKFNEDTENHICPLFKYFPLHVFHNAFKGLKGGNNGAHFSLQHLGSKGR